MSSPLECSEGKFFCLLCSQLYSQGVTHNRSSNICWLNEGSVRDLFFSWNKKYGGAGPLSWFKRLAMPSGNQALPVFSLCPKLCLSGCVFSWSQNGYGCSRHLILPQQCARREALLTHLVLIPAAMSLAQGYCLHLLHPQNQRNRGGAVTVVREGQTNRGETASQSTAPFPSLLPLPIAALSEEASSPFHFPISPKTQERERLIIFPKESRFTEHESSSMFLIGRK